MQQLRVEAHRRHLKGIWGGVLPALKQDQGGRVRAQNLQRAAVHPLQNPFKPTAWKISYVARYLKSEPSDLKSILKDLGREVSAGPSYRSEIIDRDAIEILCKALGQDPVPMLEFFRMDFENFMGKGKGLLQPRPEKPPEKGDAPSNN